MSRWQIRSLLLYSHHGQRLALDFTASAVNIIVGESYTGKSALIEVIDYSMGAGECHIPGIVREACSWVGTLWFKDKTEILLCRRVPPFTGKSSQDVHYAVGSPVDVPASQDHLRRTSNVDGALRQFEQALLMGNVSGVTHTEREGNRISFRNALPYVLVSDDVIIDKLTLLRGMNDERRQSIIDSIPYFLGAVDETTARAKVRLRRLRTEYEREQRRFEAAQAEYAQADERAGTLVYEAIQLGMADSLALDPGSEMMDIIQSVADWVPGTETDAAGSDPLPALFRQERIEVAIVGRLRSQLAAANEVLQSATGFTQTVQHQQRKLDVSRVFRIGDERETCPVCDSTITDRTETLDTIREALARLGTELQEVQQDRPQIDTYVQRLEGEISESEQRLTIVRERLAAVIRESEVYSQRLEMDQRRMRVAGRASYFLESSQQGRALLVGSPLEALLSQIGDLESLVDANARAERTNALELQVSSSATEILRRLPFDSNYGDFQAMFDARKVALQFVRGSRIMQMRDIGGDESYLSGRLSIVLALHRVFAQGDRPVPGVIVLDQISRPFYSPEANPGEVQLNAADRTDLKKYFDALFDEVATQKTLQIIILEHAYFADDKRYQSAVVKRWGSPEKLIPPDWPLHSEVVQKESG